MQHYIVNQYTIDNLLNWVSSGEIAIPEIQRPFVWKKSKVRDLMDSLYRGYPVGYVISWQNPNVRLKDESINIAIGRKAPGEHFTLLAAQKRTSKYLHVSGDSDFTSVEAVLDKLKIDRSVPPGPDFTGVPVGPVNGCLTSYAATSTATTSGRHDPVDDATNYPSLPDW